MIRRVLEPESPRAGEQVEHRKKSWLNILFLSLTPVIGVFGTAAYSLAYGVAWWEPALFFTLFGLVSFSVTAGYHRCFAHKAYVCHPAVQAFYLFFGAMAFQNSALKWSSDHRDHHRYVDKDWDPYSIKRGGLWAHILWLFYSEPPRRTYENVPDLQANRLVRWQFRLNNWIGFIGGLGIPTLIGALFGRPLAGLLWGGFLRIAMIHHTTFLVNSAAHLYGTRPYTDENSGRDNGLLAFITNGEGYHNFHHKFPSDFRNGVRWYQWDPTKWLIAALRFAGLARDLRKTPKEVIEKTRLRMTLAKAERVEKADLVEQIAALERALSFNLSGHVLHSIFWKNMSPKAGGRPGGELGAAIDNDFGDFESFKKQINAVAASIMGSGWAALAWEPLGQKLLVTQIYDHQSNLAQAGTPLLVLDAWEHAFYLQYQNRKTEFFDAVWNLWNWDDVTDRFNRGRAKAGEQEVVVGGPRSS